MSENPPPAVPFAIPFLPAGLFGLTDGQVRNRLYGVLLALVHTDIERWSNVTTAVLSSSSFGLGVPVAVDVAIRADPEDGGLPVLCGRVKLVRSANQVVVFAADVAPVDTVSFARCTQAERDGYLAGGVARILLAYFTGEIRLPSDSGVAPEVVTPASVEEV